jgi:hypothetical protein
MGGSSERRTLAKTGTSWSLQSMKIEFMAPPLLPRTAA